jgi:hypothetical protein
MQNMIVGVTLFAFLNFVAMHNAVGQTRYDFGNPGGLEQELLEQINRARANPGAEGQRLAEITDPFVVGAYNFFNVDLNLMRSELNAIPAAPPLAYNKKLAAAALGHSQWMFDNKTQSHNQTNPSSTPASRVTASGYTWSNVGENIFAYAESVTQCHAGFEVDWGGGGTGGMQAGRGHRVANHNPVFREIGIGIVLGTNAPVGPMIVTENFGKDSVASRYYATGVAYYDLDGDHFYDAGEGIAGLRVDGSGAGITEYCTTAAGGGWVIPMTSTGLNRTITFSGPGFSQAVPMTVPVNSNAKADLKLNYIPPAINSPLTASSPYPLAFNGAAGATGYRWSAYEFVNAPPENCESLVGVVTQLSPAYPALSTTVVSQGSASYHLQNSNGSDQTLALESIFHGGAGATLTFASRIRYATTSEFFKLQVKEEGASEWLTVDTQAGSGGAGQGAFVNRQVSLGVMAGKRFRIRFLLESTNSYYTTSGDNMGWFIDAIQFTDVRRLSGERTGTTATTSASIALPIGSYLVYVSPIVSGRDFPPSWANVTITASTATATYFTEMTALEASSGLAAGTLANFPLRDHDGDGFPNLVEYAFGVSVVGANDPAKVPVSLVAGNQFVLRYRRDLGRNDVSVIPQASTDLVHWKAIGEIGAPLGFTDVLLSKQGNVEFREARLPISGGGSGFLRVMVMPD